MIHDHDPKLLSRQIAYIIGYRGQELLREATLPESLWPEAIRHSV